jgi:hypothetical protein
LKGQTIDRFAAQKQLDFQATFTDAISGTIVVQKLGSESEAILFILGVAVSRRYDARCCVDVIRAVNNDAPRFEEKMPQLPSHGILPK